MLGADAAWLLGEPVRRLRLELLVFASLAVGLAVATSGSIGFVGLVVAQGWRLAGVLRTRELAVLSTLSGAALLMGADLLARIVVGAAGAAGGRGDGADRRAVLHLVPRAGRRSERAPPLLETRALTRARRRPRRWSTASTGACTPASAGA